MRVLSPALVEASAVAGSLTTTESVTAGVRQRTTAERSEIGKPVMADLLEGRVTLPIILLLRRVDGRTRDRLADVVSNGSFDAIPEEEVLQMVRTSGVLDEVRERAYAYSAGAAEKAQAFPPGPERDALIHASHLLLDRGV